MLLGFLLASYCVCVIDYVFECGTRFLFPVSPERFLALYGIFVGWLVSYCFELLCGAF